MYHDKRFQTDVNFPFVAFSHEQMMANTTQGFLLVDQSCFGDISERLINIDWAILNDIIARLEAGDHISPETDAEKHCFQLLHDLDAVSGKMHGSTTSKKYMCNEIWSLINHLGAPSWYITLSPADIQHPISIYFASINEQFSPDMPSYDDRTCMVCQNPVSVARFFHFMVQSFLEDVLGVNRSDKSGFYGTTSGYYGTVEQQGRLTLHLHMLLWILGNLNPEDVREKILGDNSIWCQKLIDWLEHCHTGDFITGTHTEVSERIGKLRDVAEYVDPTMTLPVPPSEPCKTHVDKEFVSNASCQSCTACLEWKQNYDDTVNDLLLQSNVHSCNRGTRKDGTRKKNKTYAGCMDNKWGKCKARFPRATSAKSVIDETGAIIMRKVEPWINTFTPLVTYLLRCNTDVTSLSSGTAIKSVTMYVSDYITKTTLKTHVIFDTIRSVFQKNNGMMSGFLPTKEKARRFMTKVANLLSAKAEMGAPIIAMYLLGNPDHYTGHTFVPFYWQSYVQEAGRSFDCDVFREPHKITVIKKRGRIVGLSQVHDYIHRPEELANVNLYDWIRCYEREKLPKDRHTPVVLDDKAAVNENDTSFVADGARDVSISLDEDLDVVSDGYEEQREKKVTSRSNPIMHFCSQHPLSDSHGMRYIVNNASRVPNFVGANLPRCDQGDREYYCRTMLVLFKPWRQGTDLKAKDKLWDEGFREHSFSDEQVRYMRNFNVRYECLNARDDYRAQMKKTGNAIIGSWVVDQDEEVDDDFQDVSPDNTAFDDAPTHPLDSGPIHKRRMKETHPVAQMMSSMGWTDPGPPVGLPPTSFTPDKIIPGIAWEQEIVTLKQKVIDKKSKHHTNLGPTHSCRVSDTSHRPHVANVVKVVDKSYLEHDFRVEGESDLIDSTVKEFSLNEEQERALRIIANHAISLDHDQLQMYLGGMGGTGKSQVIKALSSFFTARKEAHRFIIVAPTGTAAALLGGSTYHSMFGINERCGGHRLGNIKAKLEGVEYVFFDEVSMLSARDMYRINVQLANIFENAHVPFGGLNMIFSGDFAQLPPAVGGENVSLYSRSIGSVSTDIKSQEEAVGKALWHQITTVVVLRKNMRQNRQSDDDTKLRVALENMRYKACKPDDIAFLRSRISCNVPGRPSVCQENFRNVSIITGTNLHKDEINHLGAL